MRKIMYPVVFVIAVFCFLFAGVTFTVKAESQYVLDEYYIEFSEEDVMLPVPDIPENWLYTITIKKGEDVIADNVTVYRFNEAGNYTLIFTIYKNGKVSGAFRKTSTLKIADVVAPVISVSGYDSEYFIGDTLTILSAIVTDNVDTSLTATAVLYFGEEKLNVQNGKFTFEKTGEYSIVYSAVDKSGNVATKTYNLVVIEKGTDGNEKGKSGCGCSSAISDAYLAFFVSAILIGSVVFIRKTKANKK